MVELRLIASLLASELPADFTSLRLCMLRVNGLLQLEPGSEGLPFLATSCSAIVDVMARSTRQIIGAAITSEQHLT